MCCIARCNEFSLGKSLKSGDHIPMWLTSGLGDNLAAGANGATQQATFTLN